MVEWNFFRAFNHLRLNPTCGHGIIQGLSPNRKKTPRTTMGAPTPRLYFLYSLIFPFSSLVHFLGIPNFVNFVTNKITDIVLLPPGAQARWKTCLQTGSSITFQGFGASQVRSVNVGLGNFEQKIHSLKLTAKAPKNGETNSEFAPKNGWLEYDPFLLGRPIFKCELLVSGRVDTLLLSVIV